NMAWRIDRIAPFAALLACGCLTSSFSGFKTTDGSTSDGIGSSVDGASQDGAPGGGQDADVDASGPTCVTESFDSASLPAYWNTSTIGGWQPSMYSVAASLLLITDAPIVYSVMIPTQSWIYDAN